MSDAHQVRRALARLADRQASDLAPRHRETVAEAAAATADVERGAAFAATVGTDELARAVRAAERAGADSTARRGRRALAAYRRFRAVARGRTSSAAVWEAIRSSGRRTGQ